MSLPRVSVIIPTYNRVVLVQKAIDSVFSQSYPEIEVIVVDDGSTDGTGKALDSRYGQQLHYIWQANQGESIARNRGIDAASGDYLAFLDSDDLWLPMKIERQVEALERLQDVAIIGCQAHLIDFDDNLIDAVTLYADTQAESLTLEPLLFANTFGGGSVALARSHLVRQIGGFDPAIRFGEDWDMWLRVLIQGGKLARIPEPLALVRRHRQTQSHLPAPANTERVLHDHLRLLQRAFDALAPLSEHLQRLRARSLGRQYLEAAFAGFVWQKPGEARQWLHQAHHLDPAIWQDSTGLINMLVNYGAALAEFEGEFRPDRIDSFLRTVCEALRAQQQLPASIQSKARARLYADAGFRLFQAQDMQRARRYMTVALRQDCQLWRDWGLLRRWWATWK